MFEDFTVAQLAAHVQGTLDAGLEVAPALAAGLKARIEIENRESRSLIRIVEIEAMKLAGLA